jgi:hypothetical protein
MRPTLHRYGNGARRATVTPTRSCGSTAERVTALIERDGASRLGRIFLRPLQLRRSSVAGYGLPNHHPGWRYQIAPATPSSGPGRWFFGEWRCVPLSAAILVALEPASTPASVRNFTLSCDMRHQQVLDKLSPRDLIRAMDQDLARRVREAMLRSRWTHVDMRQEVLTPVLARWGCLFDAKRAPIHMKNVAWVAFATLLHKYGVCDQHVTAKAVAAIDHLNEDVVLSDAFARQSVAIKDLLKSAPTPPARQPRRPMLMTFLRVGDVISIQLDRYFHAAYVLQVHRDRGGTFPVIEFYAGRFGNIPAAEELTGRGMAREYGRGRFGVMGLTYLPDPANQVVAIAADCTSQPRGALPGAHQGQWIVTDLLRLQDYIKELYEQPRSGR